MYALMLRLKFDETLTSSMSISSDGVFDDEDAEMSDDGERSAEGT